jgi:uncharacterized protein
MSEHYIQKIDWNEIREAIKNSSKSSSIYVGCDSKNKKTHTIFALVVVIHIDSSKGGKIFYESVRVPRVKAIKQRLMKEVEMSVAASFEIADVIGNRKFEIHLDVNGDPKHQSNVICKEAIGYVESQGFVCQIKPLAIASSYCADHIVRM